MIANDDFTIKNIFKTMNDVGFCVKDDFISSDIISKAYNEAKVLKDKNVLERRGIGKNETYNIDSNVRSDLACWLTPLLCKEHQLNNLQIIAKKVISIIRDSKKIKDPENNFVNELLGSKPSDYSFQLALYPGNGSHYYRHLDAHNRNNHKNNNNNDDNNNNLLQRKLTFIIYLNDCKEGGSLRIYPEQNNYENYNDIQPIAGRLIAFKSEDIEHEVLPTYDVRYALTAWVSIEVPPPPNIIHETLILKDDNKIFVSIANFRDSECADTIASLYCTAYNPELISVGIVLQGTIDEMNELQNSFKRFNHTDLAYKSGRIRILYLPSELATGPCWARHIAGTLWQNETYLLQTDSHMRFTQDWDQYLKNQLEDCKKLNWENELEKIRNNNSNSEKNEFSKNSKNKPIITTYPLPYTLPCEPNNNGEFNLPSDKCATILRPTHFDNDGMLIQKASALVIPNNFFKDDKCIPSSLWAAGFSFTYASLLNEVPYSPLLPGLFTGEEISMAARLFTNGYDFWAPCRAVCYHLWERSHRPTFRVNQKTASVSEATKNSQMKIRKLLNMNNNNSGKNDDDEDDTNVKFFGLGNLRTLKDFQKRVGLNFNTRSIDDDDQVSLTVPHNWLRGNNSNIGNIGDNGDVNGDKNGDKNKSGTNNSSNNNNSNSNSNETKEDVMQEILRNMGEDGQRILSYLS